MALSKQEQRTLDEIERALRDEDPDFANAVNLDHFRRHRALVGGSTLLFGVIVLVLGEIAAQAHSAIGVMISVAGFVVMFVAIAWTIRHRNHH